MEEMTRCPCCQQPRPLTGTRNGKGVCAGCVVPKEGRDALDR